MSVIVIRTPFLGTLWVLGLSVRPRSYVFHSFDPWVLCQGFAQGRCNSWDGPSLTSLESTMPLFPSRRLLALGMDRLNALVRSLMRPIKRRIRIAARVLLEILFRSPLLLRQKSGLNERKRMASDVSYVRLNKKKTSIYSNMLITGRVR